MKKLLLLLFVFAVLPLSAQDKKHNYEVAKNLDVLTTIYKQLDLMYVDTLKPSEVLGAGINGMLRSLDPYTVYYPEDKTKDLKFLFTGKYAGIGAVIRKNYKSGRTIITEPYAGHPAAEVGLRVGDEILSIDDTSMVTRSQDDVSDHLRGDAGTTFILKVFRPVVNKEMKFKITRRTIQQPAVSYSGMLEPGIGYVSLSSFTENCAKEVRRAIADLRQAGMKKLIFDLRDNGGGSEQEAVDIVNLFVPKGQVVAENKGRMTRVNRVYKTAAEPMDTVMPVVVLVNGNTASASEITCGSLQDLDRAVVMGTRTFGKGLVQMTLDVPYNGNLKITTNKYYIPSGRCIQALNYKHSGGGYVEHVPDSLTKVFYTKGGREVRDGGGINPDIEVKPDSLTNLVAYLTQLRDSDELVLSFVIDYINKHETIASPETFKLTDADFDVFKQMVLKSSFKYDQMSERYLSELEKLARFEGYYDGAKDEFEALRKTLKHDLAKDLDYNKEALMRELAFVVVTHYYHQRGAHRFALRDDKTAAEAVKLLKDDARYEQLLHPKKK